MSCGRTSQRIAKIRPRLQLAPTECGAVCLAMILEAHGHYITMSEAHHSVGPSRDGTSALTLVRVAEAYGCDATGYEVPADALDVIPLPAILHWDRTHYVVLERLGERSAVIVDPGLGRSRVPLSRLRERYSNTALAIQPNDAFVRKSRPRASGLFSRLARPVRWSIARVLAASIAVQIFGLSVPFLMAFVVDRVLPGAVAGLSLPLTAVVVATISYFIAVWLRGVTTLRLTNALSRAIMPPFVEQLLKLPFAFFQARGAGDVFQRLTAASTLRDVITLHAIGAITDTLMLAGYLGLLWSFSPLLCGVVATIIGLQGLVTAIYLFYVVPVSRRDLVAQSKHSSYLIEMIRSVASVKVAAAEHRVIHRWRAFFEEQLDVATSRQGVVNLMQGAVQTLGLLGPAFVLVAGVPAVLAGSLQTGALIGSASALGLLLGPMASMLAGMRNAGSIRVHLERVTEVLEAETEQPSVDAIPVPVLRGTIELRDVHFRYSPAGVFAVRGLSLAVEPGQFVAIVGKSGSGKSTIAHLLSGLLRPTSGEILFDGQLLKELNLHDVRRHLGVVLQQPHMFHGTIEDNIALHLSATSRERVIEAAQLACVHDDIAAMPMGYDTIVAEDASDLSGGQRQRLGIARALVHRPSVILWDEATSALDAATERAIHRNLAALTCTRVVIAHRLSTVRDADVIYVVDDGCVVDSGAHDTLILRSAHYAALVGLQIEHA